MSKFDLANESIGFEIEVESEAARLVRDGVASPWDAVAMARDNVLDRRRKLAQQRVEGAPPMTAQLHTPAAGEEPTHG